MPKTYPMSEAQKKANMAKSVEKYKSKVKEDEIFCIACRIPVKRLSLFNHNRGKKHIEKSKELTKDYYEEMLALFEKFKNDNGSQEISTQLYYLIQSEFFDEDGCEIPSEKDKKTDAKTTEEKEFADEDYPTMQSIIEEKLNSLSNRTLAKNLLDEMEDIDATTKESRQNYLDIFRKINSPDKPKEVKIIEEPKQVQPPKAILKKVEVKEITIDEDFPTYSRFIKASNYSKMKCLENIAYNHQQIFEESSDLNIVIETIESENVDDYDEVYKRITILKYDYDENLALNGEEEEEDY